VSYWAEVRKGGGLDLLVQAQKIDVKPIITNNDDDDFKVCII